MSPGKPPLTRSLFRLVRRLHADEADLRAAERYVRDWLGSHVAGRTTGAGEALLAYGGSGRDLESRVFLASALSHVTETDDLHRASTTHPGCVVIPPAWLLGLDCGAGGGAMLRAVLVGYEAMLRVGESLGPGHYRTFHNTATAGVFGAAAAAASLLELDEERWVWAMGNAGTQAAGLWQFNVDAAMSKHLHAGHAASAGLRAALLAREGFTGAEAILEGEKGLYRGLCPDPRPEAVLREARGWKLEETSLKPYPSCRHTHPAVDAALELRDRLALHAEGADALTAVRIASYGPALALTDRPNPDTAYGAKFSIQYCTAVALLEGAPGLESFGPDRLADPGIRRVLDRISVRVDEELDRAYPERWGAEVGVRLAGGELHVARVAEARGDPEAPLTDDEIDRKTLSLLAAGGVCGEEADGLLRRCRALASGGALFDLP